jgi:hypothetical protein
MNTTKTIQSALISVFSKNLADKENFILKMFLFYRRNRRFYKNLGIPVTAVDCLIPPSWAEE